MMMGIFHAITQKESQLFLLRRGTLGERARVICEVQGVWHGIHDMAEGEGVWYIYNKVLIGF